MTLIDTARLVNDLRAVLAAITPSQINILTSIQEVINERMRELQEDIANDNQDNEETN